MSRLLAKLLGAQELNFGLMLKELETFGGHPSADVRLTAEIVTTAKQKINLLHLDSNDTNGQELYHSLRVLLEKHNRALTEAITDGSAVSHHHLLRGIRKVVLASTLPLDCWALKPVAAKRLLKKYPPKNVMKQLGYRSVDSLLKRENIAEIFCALRFLETPSWMQRFTTTYKILQSGDFESRRIEILVLETEKWGESSSSYAKNHRSNIVYSREMGVIGLLPLPAIELPGLTITLLALMTHYIQRIRVYSVYCKLQQVKPSFGMTVSRASIGDLGNAAEIASHQVSWSTLQRYFSQKNFYAEIFEPHVKQADLVNVSVTELLTSLAPELSFWDQTEYVGSQYSDGVVSYNLLDVSLNYCNNIAYANRLVYYLRESLWQELYVRYISLDYVEQNILKQLESNLLAKSEKSRK